MCIRDSNLTIRSVKALDQLLLGQDVFGVGVDAAHIPGIDSFPSTSDDLTAVSTYPDTIPISVPQDLTDTISKTAEDIRTVDLSLIHIYIFPVNVWTDVFSLLCIVISSGRNISCFSFSGSVIIPVSYTHLTTKTYKILSNLKLNLVA